MKNKTTTVALAFAEFGTEWFTNSNQANLFKRTYSNSLVYRADVTCYRFNEAGDLFDSCTLHFEGEFGSADSTFPSINEISLKAVSVDNVAFKFLGNYERLAPVLDQVVDVQPVTLTLLDKPVEVMKTVLAASKLDYLVLPQRGAVV